MLTILAIIAAVVAIGVIGVLTYAATRPDTFRLQRSIRIKAPPDKIFPLIDNLKTMNEWNPFAKQDPTIRLTYTGPASGKGAAYDWTGDGQAGQGRAEIVESVPSSQVTMRLHMIKPMEGHNTIVFALQPQSDGTDVSWSMAGTCPFIAKVIGVFVSMERMLGGMFEQGLADLKAMAEKA